MGEVRDEKCRGEADIFLFSHFFLEWSRFRFTLVAQRVCRPRDSSHRLRRAARRLSVITAVSADATAEGSGHALAGRARTPGDAVREWAPPKRQGGHWDRVTASKTGVAGVSLPRVAAHERQRDNRMQWLFASTPQRGVGCRETFRSVYVYVSGDVWDMQSEMEALGASMLPQLHAFLAAHRVALIPVCCRLGSVVGGQYPLNIVRLVLDEVERCMPLLVSRMRCRPTKIDTKNKAKYDNSKFCRLLILYRSLQFAAQNALFLALAAQLALLVFLS